MLADLDTTHCRSHSRIVSPGVKERFLIFSILSPSHSSSEYSKVTHISGQRIALHCIAFAQCDRRKLAGFLVADYERKTVCLLFIGGKFIASHALAAMKWTGLEYNAFALRLYICFSLFFSLSASSLQMKKEFLDRWCGGIVCIFSSLAWHGSDVSDLQCNAMKRPEHESRSLRSVRIVNIIPIH